MKKIGIVLVAAALSGCVGSNGGNGDFKPTAMTGATFRNCTFHGYNGVYFNNPANYLRPDDEGYLDASNLLFENVTGHLAGSAVQIDVGPGIKLRGIRNVTFRNFDVTSDHPLRFVGNVHAKFERVRFDNVVVNGVRQADGEVAGDFSEAGPLVRTKTSWEGKRL